MKILDILNSPWAILPDKLDQITEIYAHHVRREKIDLNDVRAQLGRDTLGNQKKPYDVVDGVAVLAIEGPLAKKMNMFMDISGGTSTQLLGRMLQDAVADPAIKGVVLHID